MKKKSVESFCELPAKKKGEGRRANRTAFYPHKGECRWEGIRDDQYKVEGEGWADVVRRVLIGSHGESTKFHVRYFEISPGGFSSLERHGHEHVVICIKGEGVVRTGKLKRNMRFLDVLYIASDIVHQLRNPFDEPFGFLCIVNAERDRPVKLS
ncbi:MAG: cupin domain-containing protein [Candidatus Sulfobium sp.]